jgi:hypothetical protein
MAPNSKDERAKKAGAEKMSLTDHKKKVKVGRCSMFPQ